MVAPAFTLQEMIALAQYEMLLFAGVLFALGLLDELAVDLAYFWLRLSGRARTASFTSAAEAGESLHGRAAIFIPAWREEAVIALTVDHALGAWPYAELSIFVGCYRNDPLTRAEVGRIAAKDGRVRAVIVDADGPTSKAHCLNVLYEALLAEERAAGERFHMVVLHDAEDMVDPEEIALLDRALCEADFVQLPVLALPRAEARWIGGHYSDEFAESHAKTMVVRDAIGASIPGAGVGCGIGRVALANLAAQNAGEPFARESLTEDYELGQRIAALGGTGRFLRARAAGGRLIATRAYFPERIDAAVRQKTRWTHGIALQGWDRLGWQGALVSRWMMLRDRKGPLNALLLALAYLLVGATVLVHSMSHFGALEPIALSPMLRTLLWINFAGLVWRCLLRGLFTAREYGWREGLIGIPRVFVSNVIAIVSGYRALISYVAALRGTPALWDKTDHHAHPAALLPRGDVR